MAYNNDAAGLGRGMMGDGGGDEPEENVFRWRRRRQRGDSPPPSPPPSPPRPAQDDIHNVIANAAANARMQRLHQHILVHQPEEREHLEREAQRRRIADPHADAITDFFTRTDS